MTTKDDVITKIVGPEQAELQGLLIFLSRKFDALLEDDSPVSRGDVMACWLAVVAHRAERDGRRVEVARVMRRWAEVLENPDMPIRWTGKPN